MNDVYLSNAAVQMSYGNGQRSLEEIIFDGVSAALQACESPMQDIDAVVLASHDLIDGRSLSSMVTAPAAGCYLRDEIRLAEDGLSAFMLAAAKVAAGESKRCLVAAWGRSSEVDMQRLPLACMDPFLEQPLGLGEQHISALRYSRWLAAHGQPGEAKVRAADQRASRAAANRRAAPAHAPHHTVHWPLDASDAAPRADIVVATVLSAAPGGLRVTGMGQQIDLPKLGDRDWLAQVALRDCAAMALQEARRSLNDIEAIEVDAPTLSEEAMALEALQLCDAGRGFDAYARSTHVNRSGGSAAGWCYPAMGMVRLAEVVQQMRAGARSGLAIGSGPIGSQSRTAIVLEQA